MGAFLRTLLGGLFEGLVKMIVGGGGFMLGSITNILGRSLKMVMDFHEDGIAYAREMGMSLKESQAYTENLVDKTKELAINYGLTAEQVRELQRAVTDATDRNIIMTSEDYDRYAQMSRTVGIGTAKAFTSSIVNTMGGQLASVEGAVAKAYATAAKSGLNAAKYSEKVAQNLTIASKLSFRDGVEGISKMVALSEKLGVNVQAFSNAAGEFISIENAIAGSAKLNMLGGAAGVYGSNPLEMMYEANYSPEDFADRMSNMVNGMATFNVKTGRAEIGAVEMDRMRAMADALHVDVSELTSMAKSQETIRYKEAHLVTQLQALAGNDQMKRDYILNKSQIGPDGKIYITDASGNKRDMNYLVNHKESFNELYQFDNKSDKEILQEQSSSLTSINDKLKGIETATASAIAKEFSPIINKVNAFLASDGPKIAKGIIDIVGTVGRWFKDIYQWLADHNVLAWIKEHPILAGTAAVGGYALFKSIGTAITAGISRMLFGGGGAANIGRLFGGLGRAATAFGKGKVTDGAKSAGRSIKYGTNKAVRGVKGAYARTGEATRNLKGYTQYVKENTRIAKDSGSLWKNVRSGQIFKAPTTEGGFYSRGLNGVNNFVNRTGLGKVGASTNGAQTAVNVAKGAKVASKLAKIGGTAGLALAIEAADFGVDSLEKHGVVNGAKDTVTYRNMKRSLAGAEGAALGATIGGIAGSIVPVIGNAVGASAGAAIGGAIGMGKKYIDQYQEFKAEEAKKGHDVNFLDYMKRDVDDFKKEFSQGIHNAARFINDKSYRDEVMGNMKKKFKDGMNALGEDLRALPKEISQFFKDAGDWIYDGARGAKDAVAGLFNQFDDMFEAMLRVFMLDFNTDRPKILIQTVKQFINHPIATIKGAGDAVINMAKAKVKEITDRFTSFFAFLRDLPSNIMKGLSKTFGDNWVGDLFAKASKALDFSGNDKKAQPKAETQKKIINEKTEIASSKSSDTKKTVVNYTNVKYDNGNAVAKDVKNPSNKNGTFQSAFGNQDQKDKWASPVYVVTEKSADKMVNAGNLNGSTIIGNKLMSVANNNTFANGGIVGGQPANTVVSEKLMSVANNNNTFANGGIVGGQPANTVVSEKLMSVANNNTFANGGIVGGQPANTVVSEKLMSVANNTFANGGIVGGQPANTVVGEKLMSVANNTFANGGIVGGQPANTVVSEKLMSVANNNTFANGGIVGGQPANTVVSEKLMSVANNNTFANGGIVGGQPANTVVSEKLMSVANNNTFANGGIVGGQPANTVVSEKLMSVANNNTFANGGIVGGQPANTVVSEKLMSVANNNAFANGGIVGGQPANTVVGEKLMSVAEPSFSVTEMSADKMAFSDGGVVGGDSYSGDRVLARLNSGEVVLNPSQQERLYEKIVSNTNTSSVLSNIPPRSEVVAKPVGEKEFIRVPNNEQSITQKHNELKVNDINVKISGEIKLTGGNGSKNIDIRELLNDMSFMSSLKEMLKKSISMDINGGRQMNDIATFRGMPANVSSWGHIGGR